MKPLFKIIVSVCLAALAVACTGIEKVGPGPYSVQNRFDVTLGKSWSALVFDTSTNLQEMTIDGTALNVVVFGVDIEDGNALIYSSDPTKLVPRFKADMSDNEVVEFIADSLRYNGLQNLTLENIRRETFQPLPGVRFDFTAATEPGLKMSGTCKAVIYQDRLEFILYAAPSEYYYNLHIDEVEAIFKSAILSQSASG